MRLSARGEYAVRAMVALAAGGTGPVKVDDLAREHDIPPRFLENILVQLRRAGLANSRRGADGGYWLSRDPHEITIADVIRASEGPLANVRGERPERLVYAPPAEALRDVWIAARASLRSVLEQVTLADVVAGALPAPVIVLAQDTEDGG
jgi:Rrf2 family protein